MTAESLLALTAFLFVATASPGPNNAMLAASGARFGLRRTLPHAMGVSIGFPAMLFAMALGLGEVFRQSEALREVLRICGAVIMLWIAWQIATAPGPSTASTAGRPFTFMQAVAFQWVNPKAWAMSIGVVSQYLSGRNVATEAAICTLIAIVVAIPSTHGWAGFGAALQRFLAEPVRWRVFSLGMAAIIVAGIIALMRADLT